MVDGLIQSSGATLLAGRRAIVATPAMTLGGALALGLRRQGARVVELHLPFDSRANAQAAMADAANEMGGADLVVHAGAMPAALLPRSLEALSADDWNASVHRSLLASLFCLQGAHHLQRAAGGAIVFLGPSTSLVGASGWVPLITLAEAQRTLVKSAARQWGPPRHALELGGCGGSLLCARARRGRLAANARARPPRHPLSGGRPSRSPRWPM